MNAAENTLILHLDNTSEACYEDERDNPGFSQDDYRQAMTKRMTTADTAPVSPFFMLILTAALSVSCARAPETTSVTQTKPQPVASSASPIPWATIESPPGVGPGAAKSQATRLPLRTFTGTGVIRSINLKEGWFEIDHEDIKGYMPAMRMQFRPKDPLILKTVSVGDKVNFKLEDDNGSELITELKKASP